MAISSRSHSTGNLEQQPSGHVIWLVAPQNTTHGPSSSILGAAGVEQQDKRKTLKNREINLKGNEIPNNVEVLEASEDLTLESSTFEENSSECCRKLSSASVGNHQLDVERRMNRWLEPAHMNDLSVGHDIFCSSSESAVDSSQHSRKGRATDENDRRVVHESGRVTDENGNPTSVGSALHHVNLCKPCIFMLKKYTCQNGLECQFCHLYHSRKANPRPGKKRRDQHRQLLRASGNGHRNVIGEATQLEQGTHVVDL